MDSRSTHEARRSRKDKIVVDNNDYLIDEEMDDEMDDEEALGGGNGYDEKKKGPMVHGKKGGSSSGSFSPSSCQAERCSVDLGEAKRYHRRHKVCELHAKAPAVVVAGTRQRFCQQCSRFHELSEFDEAKRSCRRRLAGHNERRRKNSAEPHGEAPGGQKAGVGTPTKDNQCRNGDERSKFQITLPGNPTYKRLPIGY